MALIQLMASIKSYAQAILTMKNKIDLEDVDKLMIIKTQLEELARKYNPTWFEPIPEFEDKQ